jgi:hypothetical protein
VGHYKGRVDLAIKLKRWGRDGIFGGENEGGGVKNMPKIKTLGASLVVL